MRYLSFILMLLFGISLKAQPANERCGHVQLAQANALKDDNYLNNREELEFFTQQWIENYLQNPTQQREIITIPVVVHIVWNQPEENISDLQIESQIEATNADFRMMNANLNTLPLSFRELAVDIEIEFCLATIDPFGNATNGITRTQTEFQNVAVVNGPGNLKRIYYDDIGGKNGWPTADYINIWVGKFGGAEIGYATMPGSSPSAEDGITIDPLFFGTTCNTNVPFNLGRTTTHEMGHFFNLYHLWGTDIGNCDQDDLVDDTPLQSAPHLGCPIFPSESCNTSNMYVNYMDYSNDECLGMFTNGQKLRMLAALNGPRSQLLTSNGCGLIDTKPRSLNGNSIAIFPNPVRDCLHIDVDLNEQTAIRLTLFNSMGQQLFTSLNTPDDIRSVDVTSLVPGIYFVNFELGKQSVTKRFIVE